MAVAVGKARAAGKADAGAAEGGKKRDGFFGDLTIAQVAAGALAAVTSMFLASTVGIAGSLIGAAVGSVVATVSSQIYRRFLNASAEKVRAIAPGSASSADRDAPSSSDGDAHSAESEPGTTAVLPAVRVPASRTPRLDDFSATVSVAVIDAREQRLRKARLQRRVVACSAVSALIAVAVTAAAIGFFTAGEGLGAKPVRDGSSVVWVQPSGSAESVSSDRGQSAESGSSSSGDASGHGGSASGDPAEGAGSGSGPGSAQPGQSGTQPQDGAANGSQEGSAGGSHQSGGSESAGGSSSQGQEGSGQASGGSVQGSGPVQGQGSALPESAISSVLQ